jgi:hypothetical protein
MSFIDRWKWQEEDDPNKKSPRGGLLAKLKRPRNHGGEAALAASHAAGVAK